jgi:hypothetical protein
MSMEQWWNDNDGVGGRGDGGSDLLGQKPVLLPLCPPQIPQEANPALHCEKRAINLLRGGLHGATSHATRQNSIVTFKLSLSNQKSE